MKYYVEINGESSLNIQGLAIQSLPAISKPLMRSKRTEIDGRDGDIITKLGYSAYDKTLKIGLWGNYDINQVIAFFNQEGVITFSNEPDKYYNFTILNREDYINQLEAFREASITIHCQPYKYELNEQPVELENEYVEQEGTSLSFNNSLVAPMNIDLKGNTLQNGTPTPSSPIPINNVSGDNDIVVCGKNICPTDFNDWQSGQYNQNTGEKETHTSRICVKNLIPITPNTNYYFDNFSSNDNFIVREYDNSKDFIKNIGGVVNNSVITTSNNGAYISITLYSNTNQTRNYEIYKTMFANGNIKPFICLASTTDKTYEAYNGTTYPINLGELKGRGTIYNYSFNASSFTSGGNRTLCIPIEANTTYYITKSMVSNRFRICLSNAVPSSSSVSVNEYSDVSTLTSTSITNTNYKYLNIFYWTYNDTYTEEQIYDSLSVYTTTPIELNKIGTYQDYIYKENDKWYLHKEIGKVVLNGSENFAVNKNQTYVLQFTLLNFVNALNVYSGILLCDNFKYKTGDPTSTTNEDYMWIFQNILVVDIRKEIAPDLNSFKTWLSTHNTSVYYQLKDATNTLITYTPLIEQLESIKNAMSKEGTTNVNQVNNDAPFIITASVLSGSNSVVVNNKGNIYSKPIMTIYGSGNIGVYLSDSQIFSINLGDEEYITLDTANMEAYKVGVLKNRLVSGDYNSFKLETGNNTISFTGNVEKVEIQNYSRWI